MVVSLNKDGKPKTHAVHRLVYQSFKGRIGKDLHIDHMDCCKTNNHISNLEAVTPEENARRAKNNGLIRFGEDHPQTDLKNKDIIDMFEMSARGKTTTQIAKKFNKSRSYISQILNRNKWIHIEVPDDLYEASRKSSESRKTALGNGYYAGTHEAFIKD